MPCYEVKLSIVVEAESVNDAIEIIESFEGSDFDIESLEEI